MTEERRPIAALLAEIPVLIIDLVKAEIEAFKADLALRAKRAGVGAGLVVLALVLICLAMTALVVAAIAALALVLPFWAAALIVAAALILIAAALGGIAAAAFKNSKPDIEGRVASIQQDVDLIRGLRKGSES